MSPKLAILFMLIGVIIGLSHVNDETATKMNVSARWAMIAQFMFILIFHRANAAYDVKRLRSASQHGLANLRINFFD